MQNPKQLTLVPAQANPNRAKFEKKLADLTNRKVVEIQEQAGELVVTYDDAVEPTLGLILTAATQSGYAVKP